MINTIYLIVLLLFLLGGILISIINRNKTTEAIHNNWLKYFSYLIIVNLILISIIFFLPSFYYLAIIISFVALIEIVKALIYSRKVLVGLLSLLIFLPLSILFIRYSQLHQSILLYTYLVVAIFDACSQLTGQLFGKRLLVPNISPNKTIEGFAGGIILSSLISLAFSGLLETTLMKAFFISILICLSAFSGDLLASICKRKFRIKDFSKLLPGQGGILDRFDSLIFSGSIITILNYYHLI